MGVASAELPSFKHSEAEFPASVTSMSQGFHEGNIFSFSDEFERPQQNHVAQQSRRDKLRVQQQGFEAAAAAATAAGGDPLVTIQEEEEESGGIYGPAGTNNMLSEMFNFPASAEDLHLTGPSTSTPAGGYHRLVQQRPDYYGGNRQDQVLMSPEATNWVSVLADDASAAAAVVKNHGMNPDPTTAMRLFFMNPSSAEAAAAAGVAIQPAIQHHQQRSPSTSTAMGSTGIAHHHPHHHQSHPNHPMLNATFGEALNYSGGDGGVMQRQLGTSLSLSSSALQHLEMRKAENHVRTNRSDQGGMFFLNSSSANQQEQQSHPNCIHQLTPPPPVPPPFCLHPHGQLNQGPPVHMSFGPVTTMNVFRNSKYARPAQELLEEFCSVGRGHVRGNRAPRNSTINPSHSLGATSSSAAAASSSSSKDIPLPLSSSDRFENQRKKSKLLSMLEEVERRYNHYCEQMQMVVNSFDSVMGFGAATPYTALAQKAMSRHFRCLKDAITLQLRQTCELLGDKDGGLNASGGLTKGETPKLRLIDQSLRQQRAFHQLGMMDHDQAWRPQRGLPDRSVTILRAWLFDHFLHPYPSDADKHLLARQTGLSRSQVSNWFINARVRLWKPMVEDMYQQEAKEEEDSQPNEDETNSHRIMSAPQHQTLLLQAADSDAPETMPVSRPNHPQPPPEAEDAATAVAIYSPGAMEDDMYRRASAMLGPSAAAQARFGAAATAAARTGDLSLTLGLRHAGGNPPETGRFGL